MKKNFFLIVLILLTIFIGKVLGQPTPGDGNLGAAGGNPVGHGGGADLGQSILGLILFSMTYLGYKFRLKISNWYYSFMP